MIYKNDKIFIAGHKGLVGSAILRKLKNHGYRNLITIEKKNLDLTNQSAVQKFLSKHKPKIIKVYISNLFQKNIKTQESIAWEHFSSRRQYTRQKGT